MGAEEAAGLGRGVLEFESLEPTEAQLDRVGQGEGFLPWAAEPALLPCGPGSLTDTSAHATVRSRMVKSIRRYTQESEQARAAALRRLTVRQSAAIVERFLRSRLAFELHFADDDHPVALSARLNARSPQPRRSPRPSRRRTGASLISCTRRSAAIWSSAPSLWACSVRRG